MKRQVFWFGCHQVEHFFMTLYANKSWCIYSNGVQTQCCGFIRCPLCFHYGWFRILPITVIKAAPIQPSLETEVPHTLVRTGIERSWPSCTWYLRLTSTQEESWFPVCHPYMASPEWVSRANPTGSVLQTVSENSFTSLHSPSGNKALKCWCKSMFPASKWFCMCLIWAEPWDTRQRRLSSVSGGGGTGKQRMAGTGSPGLQDTWQRESRI